MTDSTEFMPSFQQVPYNNVINLIDTSTHCLSELCNIIQERKEIDERNVLYSAKVSRSNIYEYEINNSTSERMLGYFKNYYLYLYKSQIKTHKDLNDLVIKDLETLKYNRIINVNTYKTNVQNSLRDVTLAEEALDKAKKNYTKARDDLHIANEKLVQLENAVIVYQKMIDEKRKENGNKDTKFSMGRMLSAFEITPEQERDKQHRKRIRKYNELISCITQIAEKKRNLMDKISLMDAALHKSSQAMQDIERSRLESFKNTMKTFCDIERASIKSRTDFLAQFEESVDSLAPNDDLLLFVNQTKQVELTHKYTNALQLMDYFYQHRIGPPYSEEIMKSNNITSVYSSPKEKQKMKPNPSSLENEPVTTATKSVGSHNSEHNSIGENETFMEGDIREIDGDAERIDEDNSIGKHNSPPFDSGIDSEVYREERLRCVSKDASLIDNGSESNIQEADISYAVENQCVRSISRNEEKQEEVIITKKIEDNPNTVEFERLRSLTIAIQSNIFPNTGTDRSSLLDCTQIIDEIEWVDLLEFKVTRDFFLQTLDEERGRRSLLDRTAYESVANAMKVCLDYSIENDDVKSAMRIANMANTFHCRKDQVEEGYDDKKNDDQSSLMRIAVDKEVSKMEDESSSRPFSLNSIETVPSISMDEKRYLQSEEKIHNHEIWRKKGFWEAALLDGVIKQMSLSEAVFWDELAPEALRESVIGVHNVVFGQLASLAFAMHALGLMFEDVETHILAMCRRAQLAEDQEHELIKSIYAMYSMHHPALTASLSSRSKSPVPSNSQSRKFKEYELNASAVEHSVVNVSSPTAKKDSDSTIAVGRVLNSTPNQSMDKGSLEDFLDSNGKESSYIEMNATINFAADKLLATSEIVMKTLEKSDQSSSFFNNVTETGDTVNDNDTYKGNDHNNNYFIEYISKHSSSQKSKKERGNSISSQRLNFNSNSSGSLGKVFSEEDDDDFTALL